MYARYRFRGSVGAVCAWRPNAVRNRIKQVTHRNQAGDVAVEPHPQWN